MGLSAIVITHNEEANIEECLRTISWVDEVVVVDALSDDRTRDIARKYTSKVFPKPWTGYVEAREYAISKTAFQWVLAIDADERVTPDLRGEIQQEITGGQFEGWLIPRKAYFLGKWIRHCGWYPGYVLRLFRKDRAKVTEKLVHEGMRVDGRIGTLRNHILHYTYPTVETYFDRFGGYTTLAAKDLHLRGKKSSLAQIALRPVFQFLKMYFAKMGFLDGLEGFILCAFSSFHVFVKYVKLWELERKLSR